MKNKKSLSRLLPIRFMVSSLIPLIFVGLITLHYLESRISKEIEAKNLIIAGALSGQVDMFLDGCIRRLEKIRSDLAGEKLIHPSRTQDYMRSATNSGGLFENIVILDAGGRVTSLAIPDARLDDADFSKQPWFRPSRKSEEPSWSSTIRSPFSGYPTTILSMPFRDGMIVGYLNLTQLHKYISKVSNATAGESYVIDPDGVVVVHENKPRNWEWINLDALKSLSGERRITDGSFSDNLDGRKVFISAASVPHADWMALFIQDEEKAFALVHNLRLLFGLGGLITAMGSLALALYTVRRTVAPLSRLVHMSNRVAAGDYDVSDLPGGYREVSDLARHFISMTEEVKRREESLRSHERYLFESETRYRSIFEGSTEGILVVDAITMQVRFVNPAACALFGYPFDEFIRLSIPDIHPVESHGRVFEEFRGIGRTSDNVHTSIPCQRKDGSVFLADIHVGVMELEGRKLNLGFFTDITTRRTAEETRIKLEALIANSPNGVALKERDGTVVFMNRTFRTLLGIPQEQPLESMHLADFLVPEDRARYETEVEPVLQETGKWAGEMLVANRETGEKLPIHLIDFTVFSSEGQFLAKAAIAVDIRERKMAETALKKSEEAYRRLVDNTIEMIVVAQDDVLKYANPAAERTLGYSADELTVKPFSEFIHSDDLDFVLGRYKRRLAGESLDNEYEFRIINREGQTRWVRIRSVVFQWKDRPATLSFLRDVTDVVDLEKQLRHVQKMEAIGTLAGGIAHDFNNILSGIIGYGQIARMKLPSGHSAVHDIDQVLQAGNRAADLVRQILSFSRRDETSLQLMPLQPIVKEALKLLRSSLPSTIEIRKNIQNTGTIKADPTELHQILMNLCTNAYHAMQNQGGVLTVTLEEKFLSDEVVSRLGGLSPGPHAVLTVSDTGCGIDPMIIGRIFDPYFTTKEKGKGTGLGLAMVHGILKRFGGSITVESELGAGSSFSIYLPISVEAMPTSSTAPVGLEGRLGGTETVLFVDDEETLVLMVREMLEQLGYKVVAFSRSADALRAFREQPDRFQVVVTDMTMPELTGIQLAREIRKVRPHIPIILCTGYSEGLDEDTICREGICRLIMKPLRNDTLSEAIREVMDQHLPV